MKNKTDKMVIMVLIFLMCNVVIDFLTIRKMQQTIDNMFKIVDIHQEHLGILNKKTKEIINHQDEVAELYYNVAYIAVATHLKCNALINVVEQELIKE